LSVEAVQLRLIWEVETAVALRFVGMEGAILSGAKVVAVAGVDWPEAFPAASRARTLYVYAVAAVRPVFP
jgi:hypothetical protein